VVVVNDCVLYSAGFEVGDYSFVPNSFGYPNALRLYAEVLSYKMIKLFA
jgi:hypothetical protein